MKKVFTIMALLAAMTVAQAEYAEAGKRQGSVHSEGLHERQNRGQLKRILGVDPVRIPWCGVYLARLVSNPPKGYASAHSWRSWKRSVKPRPGAIAIFRHSHVGLVVAVRKNCILVKSGNDGDRIRTRCRNPRSIKDYRG